MMWTQAINSSFLNPTAIIKGNLKEGVSGYELKLKKDAFKKNSRISTRYNEGRHKEYSLFENVVSLQNNKGIPF